jgi:pimeloyl-ACP methyl ester carboxylesterase
MASAERVKLPMAVRFLAARIGILGVSAMSSLALAVVSTGVVGAGQGAGSEGREFIELLAHAKWSQAEARLDARMTASLSGGRLSTLWTEVTLPLGDLLNIERVDVDQVQGYRRHTVVCNFSRKRVGLRVVLDERGNVAGFFVVPPSDAGQPDAEWKPPPYVDVSKFTEAPVTVGPENLRGALVVPKADAPFPIVVMLSGSGPNDMDESFASIKVFRDLAEGLGTRGLASLRFEKRTHRRLPIRTVKEEYLDDAAAAIAQAASVPGASTVVLLGHSLGATLAPRVAQANPQVAKLILLAGSTWPYAKLIVAQLEYQKKLGFGGADVERLLADARAEAKLIDDPTLAPDAATGHGTVGAYFLDLRGYDAVAIAGKLSIPIFFGWGERDLKVIPQDWAGWHERLGERAKLTYRKYPGLQHFFTPVGTHEVDHVSKVVVDDLAAWVKGR